MSDARAAARPLMLAGAMVVLLDLLIGARLFAMDEPALRIDRASGQMALLLIATSAALAGLYAWGSRGWGPPLSGLALLAVFHGFELWGSPLAWAAMLLAWALVAVVIPERWRHPLAVALPSLVCGGLLLFDPDSIVRLMPPPADAIRIAVGLLATAVSWRVACSGREVSARGRWVEVIAGGALCASAFSGLQHVGPLTSDYVESWWWGIDAASDMDLDAWITWMGLALLIEGAWGATLVVGYVEQRPHPVYRWALLLWPIAWLTGWALLWATPTFFRMVPTMLLLVGAYPLVLSALLLIGGEDGDWVPTEGAAPGEMDVHEVPTAHDDAPGEMDVHEVPTAHDDAPGEMDVHEVPTARDGDEPGQMDLHDVPTAGDEPGSPPS